MIIFVYGPDSFRSRAYLHKMMDKFKLERDPAGYNTTMLDCLAKENASRVISEICAAPFLAEKRMVIAKHVIGSKETAIKEELLKRISAGTIPETTVLVIYEAEDSYKAKLDKELFDILQKEKYKEHFKKLEPAELKAWILQEITARGGSIQNNALEYVAANGSSDTWELSNILDQMVAYARAKSPEKGEITLEIVKLFIPEAVDDNIFNLVDAIIAGQKEKSFAMIRAQYNTGEDSGYVFSMILRQFRILLQIKDAQARGIQPDAKAMGLHPYVLKKTMSGVQKYSFENLKTEYEKLLDIDIQTKTGSGNQSLMLDIFVGSLR